MLANQHPGRQAPRVIVYDHRRNPPEHARSYWRTRRWFGNCTSSVLRYGLISSPPRRT